MSPAEWEVFRAAIYYADSRIYNHTHRNKTKRKQELVDAVEKWKAKGSPTNLAPLED